jgi:hypothetical protein
MASSISQEHRVCEGRLNFGHWLLVNPEVLGTEWQIEVGGVPATLLLPRLPPPTQNHRPGSSWHLLEPPGAHAAWLTEYTGSQAEWGEVAEFSSRVSFVRAGVLRTAVSADLNEGPNKIVSEAFEWVERLCQWLAALSALPLQDDHSVWGYGILLFRTEQDDGSVGNIGVARFLSRPMVLRMVSPSSAAGQASWKRAITAASGNENLPTEHDLLNQARTFLHEFDTREAVIAASSAAEIALSGAIRRRLEKLNEPVVVETLLDVDGFGRLRRLATRLGVECPPQKDTDAMSRIRNAALHSGVVPSPFEAHDAVGVAVAIVQMHSPLR